MQKDPFLEASRSVALSKRASSNWVRQGQETQGRQRANWRSPQCGSLRTPASRPGSGSRQQGDVPKITNVFAPSTTSSTGPQLRLIDQKVRRTSLVGDSRAADLEIRPRRRLRPPSVRASSQKVAIVARVIANFFPR